MLLKYSSFRSFHIYIRTAIFSIYRDNPNFDSEYSTIHYQILNENWDKLITSLNSIQPPSDLTSHEKSVFTKRRKREAKLIKYSDSNYDSNLYYIYCI